MKSFGYILISVQPGRVLISLNMTYSRAPTFLTKKSTRERPFTPRIAAMRGAIFFIVSVLSGEISAGIL